MMDGNFERSPRSDVPREPGKYERRKQAEQKVVEADEHKPICAPVASNWTARKLLKLFFLEFFKTKSNHRRFSLLEFVFDVKTKKRRASPLILTRPFFCYLTKLTERKHILFCPEGKKKGQTFTNNDLLL